MYANVIIFSSVVFSILYLDIPVVILFPREWGLDIFPPVKHPVMVFHAYTTVIERFLGVFIAMWKLTLATFHHWELMSLKCFFQRSKKIKMWRCGIRSLRCLIHLVFALQLGFSFSSFIFSCSVARKRLRVLIILFSILFNNAPPHTHRL